MLVKMSEEMVLDLLMERVKFWTKEEDILKLYEEMYENYVYSGCFEGGEFNVNAIVDNDYINYTSVVSEGDEAYEDIKKLYDLQGLGDISCEDELNHGWSFIEAEYNGSFLVRH